MARARGNEAGLTIIEVMIAIAFMAIALMALLAMLAAGHSSVAAGGSESKATSYARQLVEQVKNQSIAVGGLTCPNSPNPDFPETGITRTCTIAQVGATATPNRLWRVTVVVSVDQTQRTRTGAPGIQLETMRAECPAAPKPC
jgi:Tfp pilus assembly protein PilV